jgi:hypothetical protein
MTPFTPPPDWTEASERRAWEREATETEAARSEPLAEPFTAAFVAALRDPHLADYARTVAKPWNRDNPFDRPMAEVILQMEADRLKSLVGNRCIPIEDQESSLPMDESSKAAA